MPEPWEVLRTGDRVTLFSPFTGRWTVMDAETLDRARSQGWSDGLRLRLQRLGLDQVPTDEERGRLVPVRHRRALLLPDRPAVWAPDPREHGPGGHAWRAVPLDAEDLRLLTAIDGSAPVTKVAAKAGMTAAEALRRLARFHRPELQVVQLRAGPTRQRDPSLLELAGPPRAANARTVDQHDAQGATTLAAWHHRIASGERHFDDVETTVAHALALPHPALGGFPYGARLRGVLSERGFATEGPVVEVGCGDGELASAWLDAGPVPYLRVDLSPELLCTQARAAPASRGVLGDATRLPLRDASVSLLLSNEVLADLPAVPVSADHDEVRALRRSFGLAANPPGSWENLGAWQMVVEVARVLAPGGRAMLSEFGEPDGPPEEAVQLDHPEVSIRFDHLVAIATGLGLQAELVRLDDLLGADLDAPQLARHSYEGLRALFAANGQHLAARAWTPGSVPLPEAVEGLEFVPLTQPGPGPLVTRFHALLLGRPAAG
ncbi:MAG: methyltransferase domain-containing protein [Alphaproteobacteria bacterium]|nr:methyltransferase domain-containing protein [Alphaproteobacteria bacterium]MCB9696302.1 methyltransferase domain-containing protein [Alphaproteobacteria bacterium]